MKDYYLLLEGQQTGPYTADQLREYLAEGRLTLESPAWYDGLPDWAQLGSILEAQAPLPPVPQVPVVTSTVTAANASLEAPVVHSPVVTRLDAVVQTNVKQGALLGSAVCLAIGLGLMFLTLFSFVIYAPLFLAAFILSIVAMAQGRVAGGVGLLVATLVLPTLIGLYLFASRTTASINAMTRNSNAPVAATASDSSADDSNTTNGPTQVMAINPTVPPH